MADLHAVGGMLDQKAARLVTLAREEHVFTVEYLSASGQKMLDEYGIPMLYDLEVPSVVERLGGCASVNRGGYFTPR